MNIGKLFGLAGERKYLDPEDYVPVGSLGSPRVAKHYGRGPSYEAFHAVTFTYHGRLLVALVWKDDTCTIIDVASPKRAFIGGYFMPALRPLLAEYEREQDRLTAQALAVEEWLGAVYEPLVREGK